jgi:hypothetical protein
MPFLARLAGCLISLLTLAAVSFGVSAQPGTKDPADAGQRLRQIFLSTKAAELGMTPSTDFPRVYGVAMDWPIGDDDRVDYIVTVIAAKDGTASLYTNSTFGIIGGIAHAQVRRAARAFVYATEWLVDEAKPASAFPYPGPGKVRFYILTYDGVRYVEVDADENTGVTGKYKNLFDAGQAVYTELRKMAEKQGYR